MSTQLSTERNAKIDDADTLFMSDHNSSLIKAAYYSTILNDNECSLRDGESCSLYYPEISTFPSVGLSVANIETAFQENQLPSAGLPLSPDESLCPDDTLLIKQAITPHQN